MTEIELAPLIERLRAAETFCGPLSDVNHLFTEAADKLEALSRENAELREAVTEARDMFRFYEREHRAKAEKIEEANGSNSTAVGRREKEQRNREMADKLDAALHNRKDEG